MRFFLNVENYFLKFSLQMKKRPEVTEIALLQNEADNTIEQVSFKKLCITYLFLASIG